ncbi:MAG: hypothetical protein KKH91_03430 [Elusimicrobia bacterium]|nr:hypothetical protein [Elusimicrobiota bacterium]MBU2614489.1 hypothetical protein [Elusimicrobiota bacterium]
MRFANIRELKLETNRVLKLSDKFGPVVITRKGHPIALLRTLSEDAFSVNINSLWARTREAAKRAGYGLQDVDKLIKDVRLKK